MKKYTDPQIVIETIALSDIITASPFRTVAEHIGDAIDFDDIVSRI